MTLRARTLRTVTPASTGTADFTISGIGTPIAAEFELVVARLDNTDSAPAAFSRGFWANNGSFGCVSQTSEDNSSSNTDTYSACSSGRAGAIISIAGAEFLSFSVDSVITDGLRLNFNVATGLAHRLTITFYYGSGVSAHVGTFNMADNTGTPNQTLDVTAPGFQPDFVKMVYGGAAFTSGSLTVNNGIEVSYGMAARSSGGVQQIALGYSHADNIGTTAPSLSTDESHVIRPVIGHAGTLPLTTRHQIQLDSFLSTGFRVKDTKGSNPNEVLYLAIRWGGRNCDITKVQSPTTASTVNVDLNKRPNYLCSINTAMTAVGDRVNAQAGQFGFGVADRFDQSTWMQRETDAATTTDNAIQARDDYFMKVTAEDGTGGLQASATLNDDNYDLVYDAAFISARFQWVLMLEEPIGGTSVLTFPKPVLAAQGREVMRATGAPVFPSFQTAGQGRQVFRGTSALTFPSFQVAGVGTHPYVGTSSNVFPSFQVNGAGNAALAGVAGNGAFTFPSFQTAAQGREVFQGTGAPQFPSFQVSGQGREVFRGTSALVFPSFQTAAAGSEVFRGTSGLVLPSAQVASEGAVIPIIVGTSVLTFPGFQTNATGSSGQFTVAGTSALTLPKLQVASTGREVFRGTSALNFPSFQVASAGREVFRGPSTCLFPSFQVSSQAREVFRGTSAFTFPSFQTSSAGREVFQGASGLILPSFQTDADGTVTLQIVGAGACVFPGFQCGSQAQEVMRAQGALVFPKLQVAGTSTPLLFSVAELEATYSSQIFLEASIS